MSIVTNLILHFSIGEDQGARIKDVNSFRYRDIQLNLVSVDFNKDMEKGYSWYGGTKFLETPLYIGAFNHFDLRGFVDHLKKIRWEKPQCVQVIVKEQDDEKFRIIELG